MAVWQILQKQLLEKQLTNPNIKIPTWLIPNSNSNSDCKPETETRKWVSMLGEKNHQWKGGRIKRDGYILVNKRDHPFADKRGYVREHRLVWEQHHNAMLLPWAHCRHLNSVKDDNRIENLQAMMHREHTRLECLKLKPWISSRNWKQKQQQMKEAKASAKAKAKKSTQTGTGTETETTETDKFE